MKKHRPFNLAAAKRGEKVQTRDGLPVELFCFDFKWSISEKSERQIVGRVKHPVAHPSETITPYDTIARWHLNGRMFELSVDDRDLVMAPKKGRGK